MHLLSGTLITVTDSSKLERIQRKFVALCYTKFFNGVCDYNYEDILIIALMMEAARTSETLVNFYQTTRCYNPEDSNLHILIRLNFSMLHLRRRHLDVLFSHYAFKGKISCSSVFDTVSLHIPTKSIRDYTTLSVHRNFKVSPSARCVYAANAVCRSIDIFNSDCILLTDVSQVFKYK
jgi:hypothetical protein